MERTMLRVLGIGAVAVCVLSVTWQIPARARMQQLEREAQGDAANIARLTEANNELSNALARLREGKTPWTPAVALSPAAAGEAQAAPARSNNWARMAAGDKLSLAQVEEYLKKAGRSAPNLLAAFRSSGDAGLLREAMEKYPDDPHVAFEAVVHPAST